MTNNQYPEPHFCILTDRHVDVILPRYIIAFERNINIPVNFQNIYWGRYGRLHHLKFMSEEIDFKDTI